MNRLIRILLLICGTLCVALAVLGMFLPILPTTPFLLLAAVCYARSSERFYNWLITNRWCGRYIRSYREGRGVPLRHKVVTILLLWLSIGYAAWFLVPQWWGKLILAGIAAGVTIHLVRIKTCEKEGNMATEPATQARRSGCVVWGLRIAGGLLLLLVVLLLAGYVYQSKTTADDFRQFPAPGQRVDVGGYSLHLYCTGAGRPTVVVDAGNGDFSPGWSLVQPQVAAFTRICTYDRAGYGWSDPGPRPRSAEQIAAELHALLSNASIPGPYVLVGHSMGGYDVRTFAHLYPDDVVGMVLVDAGHEEQFSRLPAEYERINRQQESYLRVMASMARFGLLRLMGSSSGGQDLAPVFIRKLPAEAQETYLALMSHPAYFDTTLAELAALPESNAQVGRLGNLGDLPLYVLTAGNSIDADALASIGLPADFDVAQLQRVWLELQGELAALSTNSTHTIVADSPHAIHIYQPERVVEAIRQVVEATR